MDNAMAVANHLQSHSQVAWVQYAGLPDSKYYDLAQKYTNGRPSALLCFGVKGGYDAGVKFYDALKLFKRSSTSATPSPWQPTPRQPHTAS